MILDLRHCKLLVLAWLAIFGSMACTERVSTTPTSPSQNTNPSIQLPAVNCSSSGVSPTSLTVAASGERGSISVTANIGCSWTATSNMSWLTVTGGNIGNANGTVSFTADANSSPSQRTGTLIVTVTGPGPTFTVITVTVTQAGQQPGAVTIIARDDSYTMARGSVLTVPAPGLLANDSVPTGPPPATIRFVQPLPPDAGFTNLGGGSFRIDFSIANSSFTGMLIFQYEIFVGGAVSNAATVTVTVN